MNPKQEEAAVQMLVLARVEELMAEARGDQEKVSHWKGVSVGAISQIVNVCGDDGASRLIKKAMDRIDTTISEYVMSQPPQGEAI